MPDYHNWQIVGFDREGNRKFRCKECKKETVEGEEFHDKYCEVKA